MKHYTLIVARLLSFLLPVQSWSGDFQRGEEADNRGHFITSVKLWRPLAEQGDAESQYRLARLSGI